MQRKKKGTTGSWYSKLNVVEWRCIRKLDPGGTIPCRTLAHRQEDRPGRTPPDQDFGCPTRRMIRSTRTTRRWYAVCPMVTRRRCRSCMIGTAGLCLPSACACWATGGEPKRRCWMSSARCGDAPPLLTRSAGVCDRICCCWHEAARLIDFAAAVVNRRSSHLKPQRRRNPIASYLVSVSCVLNRPAGCAAR